MNSKKALENWFEAARSALADAAGRLNYQTFIPYEYAHHEPKEGGVTASYRTGKASLYNHFIVVDKLVESVVLPPIEPLFSIADHVLEQYGEIEHWQIFPGFEPVMAKALGVKPHDYEALKLETARNKLIGQCFGRVMSSYLRECEDLGIPEPDRLKKAVENLFAFLKSKSWTTVSELAVCGLLSTREIEFDSVQLRPISSAELDYWMDSRPFGMFVRKTKQPPLNPFICPTHILKVTTSSSSASQPADSLLIRKIVIALQILGFDFSGQKYGESRHQPQWAFSAMTTIPSGLPIRGKSREIRVQALRAAQRIAHAIPDSAVHNPVSAQEIAIHRFHSGLNREYRVDSLLDLTIALEAILLPKIQGELVYRFKLNGAAWAGGSAEDRKKTFRELGLIYNARSKMVHGERFPSGPELETLVDSAKHYVQLFLGKAFTSGWPTEESFQLLTVGGQPAKLMKLPF